MKKAGLIILSIFTIFFSVSSQNIDDALRYSQLFYNGTARFNAMGGAFTALGGDLSSLSLNPAGIGVYRSSEITVTPQLIFNNYKSLFNNSKTSDVFSQNNLNQIGVVINMISNDKTEGLINLNVGYSYMRTNIFREEYTIKGVSTNSSMADYWAGRAEGTNYSDLTGPEGYAFDAWVIDTVTGSGGSSYGTVFSNYGENANSTYGQTIRRIISNQGYSGEHAFSVGGNYSNKIYFGATLGISRLSYTGDYEHLEADYDNVIPDFKNFTYIDHFEATGTGFSLKIGAIIKPVDFIRIGFAFHSPIIYRIHEYTDVNISAAFDDNLPPVVPETTSSRYSYTLTTPFRAVAGVAIQIKKLAVVSADYEIVDYRMAHFSNASDDYKYNNENDGIQHVFKPTSNLRLGTEFRLSNLYFRGGYGYYGKAFKSGELNDNLDYNSYSLGFGFRQANFFFDLAYTNLSSTQKYLMYENPDLQPATISKTRNAFTATLGFKF